MLMFSHITTSLYVITEPTERQKVYECEKMYTALLRHKIHNSAKCYRQDNTK